MNSKPFVNQARQSWEAVHVEAWQRSCLTRTAYCRQASSDEGHTRLLAEVLCGKDAARKHAEYPAESRRQKHLEAHAKRQK
ncbi:hypothetical protein FJ941_02520 [Mesorhizobium sp. B2-3-13]|uniref:hypothetical protein n=1 Tax=Mesorhizobium sp. B2-3-13 TaxID=2589951 RepID=UPI00112A6F2B|nr:hypothetical protein [Mesorhizobium sp. B2-3-13]TPL89708.1 hypothetical protein FJ941_02520 [Mesorhizobium sp. B2-3-13]